MKESDLIIALLLISENPRPTVASAPDSPDLLHMKMYLLYCEPTTNCQQLVGNSEAEICHSLWAYLRALMTILSYLFHGASLHTITLKHILRNDCRASRISIFELHPKRFSDF